MLYYPTEIRPYDSSSAELADSRMGVYEILRAILEESILDRKWYLTFRLAAEGAESRNFTMSPPVYMGYGDKKGLLEVMGNDLPKGLKNNKIGITRLLDLEELPINLITLMDGLMALYPALNSGESRVI